MGLNPLTNVIESSRMVIFSGGGLDWGSWLVSMVVGCCVACVGAWVFYGLRDGFADVV